MESLDRQVVHLGLGYFNLFLSLFYKQLYTFALYVKHCFYIDKFSMLLPEIKYLVSCILYLDTIHNTPVTYETVKTFPKRVGGGGVLLFKENHKYKSLHDLDVP